MDSGLAPCGAPRDDRGEASVLSQSQGFAQLLAGCVMSRLDRVAAVHSYRWNEPAEGKAAGRGMRGAVARGHARWEEAVASSTPAPADTFPKLLLRNARAFGGRPAMRHKDLGIWQTWTWAQMRDEVLALTAGLHRLGLKRGETVAIVGANRPKLYWSVAAVQALGGIPVPVYADAVADELAFVLAH